MASLWQTREEWRTFCAMTQYVEMPAVANSIAEAYMFLARAFAYPEREFIELLGSAEGARGLSGLLASLPFQLAWSDELKRSSPWEDLEAEYIAKLDVGNHQTPPCSLHEGVIRPNVTRVETFTDLLRCYDYFGVNLSDSRRRYPDYLGVQLEFMAFLGHKVMQVEEDGGNSVPLRRAQRDFLERHLLSWIPLLNERIGRTVGESFYKSLSRLLLCFLERHHQYLAESAKGPMFRKDGTCHGSSLFSSDGN